MNQHMRCVAIAALIGLGGRAAPGAAPTTQPVNQSGAEAPLPEPPPIPDLSGAPGGGVPSTPAARSLPSTTSRATAPAAMRPSGASSVPSTTASAPRATSDLPLPPPIPGSPSATGPAPRPQPPATQASAPPASGPTSAPREPSVNPPPGTPSTSHEITITADLDRSRDLIAPSLGAVSYTIGPNQIKDIPGGENAPFQQVLLRSPGVVEDSFGQEHVRGEHANLTYRVNGVLLPASIGSLGGFGQELDTRIINSVTLIDGTLPAQFGFRTAGVVDVTTKSGATLNNNQFSLYGGSYDTIQPSLQLGGTSGKWDYFVVASDKYTGLGIEDPTSSTFPLHDYSNQEKFFGYFGYRIDDTSRLMVLLNASYANFQIPDRPNVAPSFTLPGRSMVNSANINDNQNELDNYEVISYQKSFDKLSLQASVFSRYGRIHFSPDPTGDLLYQGVASEITNGFLTDGMQFDASYNLDERNTVRFGFLGDYTNETLNTNTSVFAADTAGAQASSSPFAIADNRGNWGAEYGAYLQNEWKLSDHVTVNYGARFDRFDASFDHEGQLSPRANLVWKIDKATTAHVGYSRYFEPPPVQYVWPGSITRFSGTTNAPENFRDDPLRAERSNYYDVGLSRQLTPAWQVTVDGFYKGAKPLLDSGQFGNAIILAPFNYREGRDYGAELSSTYKKGGVSLFGNFAWVSATGRDISSSEYLIGNSELTYISSRFIKLDHESEYTASAGASYVWKNNRVYMDILYGSGLRAGFANTMHEPQYYPVNVGFEHVFHPAGWGVKDVRLRFDISNVFDEVYQLRNGTGIGVGAPQYGARRGFYGGLTFDF